MFIVVLFFKTFIEMKNETEVDYILLGTRLVMEAKAKEQSLNLIQQNRGHA